MPVPSSPDAELARKVLEHIEANPGQWNQAYWAQRTECGTAYCFAGHVVSAAHPGAVFEFGDEDSYRRTEANRVSLSGAKHRLIMYVAQETLGLNQYSAEVLFAPSNALEHLRDYVAQLERPDFSGDLTCVNPNFGAEYEDENDDDDRQVFDD